MGAFMAKVLPLLSVPVLDIPNAGNAFGND